MNKILTWLFLDYLLLFMSLYFIYVNQFFILRDFLLAMALVRCQYQHHDFAHGQFDKMLLFNKEITKFWFLLTTGISTEYWNDIKHMPHHINVNNFNIDPDDFQSRISSNYKLVFLLLFPGMSIKSLLYLIKIQKFYTAFVNLIFLLLLFSFIYYYFLDYCLFSMFYLFTFALTQWFHHPKYYIQDSDPLRRQVLNSRNIRGHNFFINYWMGGNDYQIEHHLYPKASRYELAELSKNVRHKYSSIYQEITVYDAITELFHFLTSS